MVHSDGVLRIMDNSALPWNLIAEIPEIDRVEFQAISPVGEFIGHSNAQQIVVRRLPSGDQVFQVRRLRTGEMVFHPSEPWVVASGDSRFSGWMEHRKLLIFVSVVISLSLLETFEGLKNRAV